MDKLYRQELKEPDAEKRVARVEERKQQVLRMAVEEGDSDQRHAVSEALHLKHPAKRHV